MLEAVNAFDGQIGLSDSERLIAEDASDARSRIIGAARLVRVRHNLWPSKGARLWPFCANV